MKAENLEQSFALEEMREIISHLIDVFTALNQSEFSAREYAKKRNLSSPVGGISNRFSPFSSRLRHSNFAQTIPPATQAKDGLGMQIG